MILRNPAPDPPEPRDDGPVVDNDERRSEAARHERTIQITDDDAPGPLIEMKPDPKPDDPWED